MNVLLKTYTKVRPIVWGMLLLWTAAAVTSYVVLYTTPEAQHTPVAVAFEAFEELEVLNTLQEEEWSDKHTSGSGHEVNVRTWHVPLVGQASVSKALGRIRVDSEPEASIYIDGRASGKVTPYTLDVTHGMHRVHVRFDDGKVSKMRTIKVEGDGLNTLFWAADGAERSEEDDLDFSETSRAQEKQAPLSKKKKVRGKRKKKWPSSVLIVVADFEKLDVDINGKPYPEYYQDQEEGMVLPSGGPYTVRATYEGKVKVYSLSLRPHETRYLVVEIPGFKGGALASTLKSPTSRKSAQPPAAKQRKQDEVSEDEHGGRVTVYSKPRGQVLVDSKDSGKKTPNTVDAEPGRHEIQVRYEDGEVSEKKIVRVRKGSRIKLFFRQKSKDKK